MTDELIGKFSNLTEIYVFRKAIDYSFNKLNQQLKKFNKSFHKEFTDSILMSFQLHSTEVINWSKEVTFNEFGNSKKIKSVFIDLDLYLEPVEHLESDYNKRIKFSSAIRRLKRHLVLLGKPGAGKTTTMKMICYKSLLGESYFKDFFPIPIVIRLRTLNNPDNPQSIYKHIYQKISVKYENLPLKPGKKKRKHIAKNEIYKLAVHEIIDSLKIILILDGFDEISSKELKENIREEIENLCLNLNEGLLITTSRTADFPYSIQNSLKYELSELSRSQVSSYIKKVVSKKEELEHLEKAIFDRKLLGAELRPLTLALLCTMYLKYGKLPDNRKEIYNRIINLLVEDWDIQRSVERKSRFIEFDSTIKKDFLCQLAYELTRCFESSIYLQDDLRHLYLSIFEDYKGLEKRDFKLIFQEIETNTGLFIKSGPVYYEFQHKSIQEYLCATYILDFPEIPRDRNFLKKIPNEMALAVGLSKNPSLYFSYLILDRFTEEFYEKEFLLPFIDRIMLEEVSFRVNPLFGLSFIVLFNKIKQYEGMYLSDRFLKKEINQFYSFLNSDKRIEKSIIRLKEFYEVENQFPAKNLATLKKVNNINFEAPFLQPETLQISYELIKYWY